VRPSIVLALVQGDASGELVGTVGGALLTTRKSLVR
jgi:hypothetical protein